MDIKKATKEQLQARLDELEKADRTLPPMVEKPDWSRIIAMAKEEAQSTLDGSEEISNDFEHYVYEEVMKAVYGPKYFEWANKTIKAFLANGATPKSGSLTA